MLKNGEKKLYFVNCDFWCIIFGFNFENFVKISRDEINVMWFFIKFIIFNFVKIF